MAVLVYVLFALGVPLLWKSADLLVDGGVAAARKIGVSSLLVGLTIVSFGTSAPEMGVNLLAGWRGETDLAIGNIFGSNVANTLLVLGAAALLRPVSIYVTTVRRELPFSILVAGIVALMANDILRGGGADVLSLVDGLILLGLFAVYLGYMVGRAGRGRKVVEGATQRSWWFVTFAVVGGLIGLFLASEWIVDGAVAMARALGVSQAFIGFSVVALGTSLPELATTLAAAFRGESDIAVGNIIGSNIFNLLLVLGATSTLVDIPYDARANVDLAVIAVSGLALMAFTWRGSDLDRREGVVLLLGYVAYLVFLVWRG